MILKTWNQEDYRKFSAEFEIETVLLKYFPKNIYHIRYINSIWYLKIAARFHWIIEGLQIKSLELVVKRRGSKIKHEIFYE